MKNTFVILLISFFFFNISFSQNLFDIENSEKYAAFLFRTKDYKRASAEYERLIFLSAENFFYKTQLINSYKFLGETLNTSAAIEKYFGKNIETYPPEILNTYLQMNILQNNYNFCDSILKNETVFSTETHKEYRLALLLLLKKYSEADTLIHKIQIDKTKKLKQLITVYLKIKKTKFKNPFLASVLSLIFPGLGKIYANDIKNGLGVLSLVGLSAWQSYRGFNKEGINSFYGWGFGAIAAGFYLGNIYGAGKSAKRENQYRNKKNKKKIIKIIVPEYSE